MSKVYFSIIFLFAIQFTANAMKVVDGKVILEKIKDYDFCQGKDYSGDYCHQALLEWVEKNPKDAFQAGKMTRLKMSHWTAIPFFEKAWAQGLGDCKDEDVKLSVMSALGLPANQKEIIGAAVDISLNKCEKEFKDEVVTLAKSNDYVLKNTCKTLLDKKALTGVAAKRCLKI